MYFILVRPAIIGAITTTAVTCVIYMNNKNNNEMPFYNMATISLYDINATTTTANILNVVNKNNTNTNSRYDYNNKYNFYLSRSKQQATKRTTKVITAVRTKGSSTVGFNNSSSCINNTITATYTDNSNNTNTHTTIANTFATTYKWQTAATSFNHNCKSHNKRNYFKLTLALASAILSKTSVNGKPTLRFTTTLTGGTFQNVLLAFSCYNPFSHNTVAS